VLYYAIGQVTSIDASAILPPDHGFAAKSFVLQLVCTGLVILACSLVVSRGLRAGIERASKFVLPVLGFVIVVLMIRSLTLPGSMEGVRWFILKFRLADLTPTVMVAAIGHAMFSLSLGGTFMVVYGSYLSEKESLSSPAIWTVIGDTGSALLCGFAILPAVFALGLEPASGPGLVFATLPKVFASIPAGAVFGALFFLGLFGAGFLSDIGAFEVLVAGLTDNTRLSRPRAMVIVAVAVFVLAIPPMINNAIFVPWDLTFGSGMQTLGALIAVLAVGWSFHRAKALRELGASGEVDAPAWLYYWIRFGIPAVILVTGIWWLLSEVFGTVTSV
jgi:NSS family neurotransmitter:Na+ symporter